MSKNVHKLSQELINQIAAGEVIERPASVVKELIDNSIDAKATEIKVKVKDGGLSLIEVSDNGEGIDKEELELVFEPHTTSKIAQLEDLNSVQTLGFRGEALSTIKSVSKVAIISKKGNSQIGFSIDFEKGSTLSKSAKEIGTSITIKNLFHNTPARLKFMKTHETEYRKILELLHAYALSNIGIHFVLEKDGKEVLNLPASSLSTRIKAILKKNYTERLIEVDSNGSGIHVYGYVAHPSDSVERTKDQYIYVNGRNIWDNGIAKSVKQGYSRFIPYQNKVPFVLFIVLDPSQVDVNVHPRKEEIKFINPFRVYSQIEQAVSYALEQALSINEKYETIDKPSPIFDRAEVKYSKSTGGISQLRFDKRPSDFNIQKSLKFSKEALAEVKSAANSEFISVTQIFNKYILIEFKDELWVIDQHAAAERITFEKLLSNYSSKSPDVQALLVPENLDLNDSEKSFVSENLTFFKKLGFEINENLDATTIPAHLNRNDVREIFKSICELPEESRELQKDFDKARDDILATVACHSSIRTGQPLSQQECVNVFLQLRKCKNPFSCPHGRPAIWKLSLSEIDSHFLRTY